MPVSSAAMVDLLPLATVLPLLLRAVEQKLRAPTPTPPARCRGVAARSTSFKNGRVPRVLCCPPAQAASGQALTLIPANEKASLHVAEDLCRTAGVGLWSCRELISRAHAATRGNKDTPLGLLLLAPGVGSMATLLPLSGESPQCFLQA